MIGIVWFQAILDGLGWLLARLYDLVPNYGVTIVLFTLGIRLLLLPLGIKQIRSMQATAVMQPKMKAIQQKYKQDRQRQQEELMKLYKEYGYNPLSGCFPLLAQLPVLIALFAVLQFPKGLTHIPTDSRLYSSIVPAPGHGQHTSFLGANLICSAVEAGHPDIHVSEVPGLPEGKSPTAKNCGKGFPVHIPYYAFAIVMIGATYYQQRQIQKSSPMTQNPQQQTIMRIMPLMFGVYGFIFPAGLVVYWSTTTLVQVGQQYVLIHRKGAPLAPQPIAAGDGDGDKGTRGSKAGSAGRGGGADGRRGGRTDPRRGGAPRSSGGRASAGRSSGGRGSGGTRAGAAKSGSAKSGGAKSGNPKATGSSAAGTARSSFGGRRGGVPGPGGSRSSGGNAGGSGRAPRVDPGGGARPQDGGATGGSGARDARDRKKRPER